jgi:predicted amidohydrolase
MKDLRISTAQFEHRSNDKTYNLSVIDSLSARAAAEGSLAIAFHECSVSGYTFAMKLGRKEMLDLAEKIPGGPSVSRLISIARRNKIAVLAGLFEKDDDNRIFNTYVCVNGDGIIAKHRKLHPFINRFLVAGDSYCIFGLEGWKCGILICYDNNVIENVRATTLLGANVIFMPHITMCTPSTRPGAGFVDPAMWYNREKDPESLRREFDGLKGRAWLMKWLPARAYDNGIYIVFSNPIGMDDDQLKNGCSMIIDPFGDTLAECRKLDNDLVTTDLGLEKVRQSGGGRYLNARRPDLYRDIIGREHKAVQKVIWMNTTK